MNRQAVLRRVLALALLVSLLALVGAPALAASNTNPGGAYVVTASKLNLRSAADYFSSVQKKLPRNTVVIYKGQSKGWWKVQYSGGTGYVDRRYLSSVNNYTGSKFAPVCNLYVRSKASASSYAVGKMKMGLKVKLVKQKGNWMYIDYKGKRGWVASRYMKKV